MMSIKYRTCEARWNGKGSEVVIRLHRAIFLLTYPCPPRGCSLIRYIKERKPFMQSRSSKMYVMYKISLKCAKENSMLRASRVSSARFSSRSQAIRIKYKCPCVS